MPFAILDYKVNSLLGKVKSPISVFDRMKLFIYEGHDTNLVNFLLFLGPTNRGDLHSYLATQIITELHYSEECLQSEEAGEQCFAVQITRNDEPLEFEGSCKDPKLCTYPEFSAYIGKLWYREPGFMDWEEACSQTGPL